MVVASRSRRSWSDSRRGGRLARKEDRYDDTRRPHAPSDDAYPSDRFTVRFEAGRSPSAAAPRPRPDAAHRRQRRADRTTGDGRNPSTTMRPRLAPSRRPDRDARPPASACGGVDRDQPAVVGRPAVGVRSRRRRRRASPVRPPSRPADAVESAGTAASAPARRRSRSTVEDKVVDDFNASHPNIHLTFEVVRSTTRRTTSSRPRSPAATRPTSSARSASAAPTRSTASGSTSRR